MTGVVADHDAATDQLVDEICERLSSLYTLLDTSLTDHGPTVLDIRTHADEVVRRLAGPHGRATATLLARILWPPQPGHQIPAGWWNTPLATVLTHALARPQELTAVGARSGR